MTNGQQLRQIAEQRGIPLRSLAQVRAALNLAKLTDADAAMARLMLKHGRMTDEARAYLVREYPQ